MNVQQSIVERVDDSIEYLSRLRRAISAVHAADLPAIYLVVRFRTGHPEVSGRNRAFSTLSQFGGFAPGRPGHRLAFRQNGRFIRRTLVR
ncbi:hypothetical protein ACFOSC_10370 [Streptantibioticus rubrisoli]|uniref:Uncharacterized protein n=1 Tax=Streptantibioticus rubrisoli TaxID=1387313 RepID=A0ABT1PEG5_9ACTN|nr:hypothetical protein [Streptantibioticus rubrisoli]MCQ4042720.1 hypothetical protein [Streptantibioticus rubrisoli]